MVDSVAGYFGEHANKPENLREAVEALKRRFSSIMVETSVADDGTGLWVNFRGDKGNLPDRQLLVRSFAQAVPQGFSVIGIKQSCSGGDTKPDNKTKLAAQNER